MKTTIIFFIIYFITLLIFSNHFKTHEVRSYSLNGDLWSLAKDNHVFDNTLSRETANKFKTDTEKCEWALEKLRDICQFFSIADNSLWPYQVILSLLASLAILYQLKIKINYDTLFPLCFFIFVIIDLPRRFLSFHKNAAIANKALNVYMFYYKNMKGKNVTEKDIYMA